MKIQVLLFGRLTEIIGQTHLELTDVADTDAVKLQLLAAYPSLMQVNYQVAVDQEIIHANRILTDGMVMALMPPFSGG